MWDGDIQKKIKCSNGSCFTDSKSANDDSEFVKFVSIHILLSPIWLVFILQYFSSPVFMTVSILVNKLDNCFEVHFLEPVMKRYFTGDLCSLGVQYR